MSLEIISLAIPVFLAFAGYMITYWYNLRLAKRKEQLDLVNKRLNDFYGPLYITSQAGYSAYKTLLTKLNRKSIFEKTDPPPDDQVLEEWRIWLTTVFMPLNEIREQLILENAHLIREEQMPECLLQFIAHVSVYKAIVKKWELGDYSEHAPLIDYPQDLMHYLSVSYRELKEEQMRLIGKRR